MWAEALPGGHLLPFTPHFLRCDDTMSSEAHKCGDLPEHPARVTRYQPQWIMADGDLITILLD